MFIFLLGILFFVVATQSVRLPYNNNDESSVQYQRQLGSDGYVNDGHLIDKLIKNIDHRNLANLAQSLKRSKRDFNNQQRQFQRQMLQAHNKYRSRHGAPPLQLDDNLSASAQRYAEYLVALNRLQHSGSSGVGENLWMLGSSTTINNINGNQPTDDWYHEVRQYNYNQPGFSESTGHFTQLVWKNTKTLGAGIAYNSDRTKVYVVAQYSPPGNYLGRFRENVLPAGH